MANPNEQSINEIFKIIPLNEQHTQLMNKSMGKIKFEFKNNLILTEKMCLNAIAFGNTSNDVDTTELNKFYMYTQDFFLKQYYISEFIKLKNCFEDNNRVDNINEYYPDFDTTIIDDIDDEEEIQSIIGTYIMKYFENNSGFETYITNIRYYILFLATFLHTTQFTNTSKGELNPYKNLVFFNLSVEDYLKEYNIIESMSTSSGYIMSKKTQSSFFKSIIKLKVNNFLKDMYLYSGYYDVMVFPLILGVPIFDTQNMSECFYLFIPSTQSILQFYQGNEY